MSKLDLAHNFTLRLWVLVLYHKLLLDCHEVLLYLGFDMVYFDVCVIEVLIKALPRLRDIVIATSSFFPYNKRFKLSDRILQERHQTAFFSVPHQCTQTFRFKVCAKLSQRLN